MNRRKLASDPGYAKSAAQSFELDSEAMTKDQKDHKQEAEALIKRDDLSKAHKFTQVTAKPVWIYVTCKSQFFRLRLWDHHLIFQLSPSSYIFS